MDSRRLNFRLRVILRALVYATIIGSLLMVGMHSSEVGGTPPTSGKTISFGPGNDVGTITDIPSSVALGDLDDDGDLDTVCGSWGRGDGYEVIAWENDGSPFTDLWNQNDVGASTDFVESVALGDLDSDGDLDIVSGSRYQEDFEVIAWENDGTPFTGLWAHNDVGGTDYVLSVALGDLDNDGDLDIVSGSSSPVTAWENDGTPFAGLWNKNDVRQTGYTVLSVALGDLDNDGDLDIVSGSSDWEDYEVIAWENDGSPFTDPWSQNEVGASISDMNSVAVGDLDNDGDLDIVSGSSDWEDYKVMTWENDGSPFAGLWSQTDVGGTEAVSSVALGDLDDDGDLDIVSGGSGGTWGQYYEVIAWENDSTPFTDLWPENGVRAGTGVGGVASVALGDLGNDGDPDIVSGGSSPDGFKVIAWENTSAFRIYLALIARRYCPDFFDDFSNPASGWPVDEDDYVRSEYMNGEYRVLTKRKGYLYLFGAPTCDRQNYTVELDARWADTPANSYGILFGITDDFSQYYLFDMNTDFGQFRLYRRDPSGFTQIVPPRPSWTINRGTASNHMKATRNGSSITLEVNGIVLGTWSDGAISGLTAVGLVSSPYDRSPVSDARFDNFSVISLPGSGALVQGPSRTAAEECELCIPYTRREPLPADIRW